MPVDVPSLLLMAQNLTDVVHAASSHGLGLYATLLSLSTILNPLAAIWLSCMAAQQLLLVAYNRTTLNPLDWRYDVGVYANWQQVFGRRASIWALPLIGDGPNSD